MPENDLAACRRQLLERLGESAPGRIQMLVGPRQVGKTTLLLDLVSQLGPAAFYASADEPAAALPGFFERLIRQLEETCERYGAGTLMLDEMPHLSQWDVRLKSEWDRILRYRIPAHLVVSGSSALKVGAGSRESLAGRFERLVLNHWTARTLADELGLDPEQAVQMLVEWGSYPGAFALLQQPARWLDYLRDAIVEPALGRDLLALTQVRKPALLRQLFAVCAASPAQIVSLQKLQGHLLDPGALETLAHYLELLRETFFVAPLPKFSPNLARRRAAPPKLVCLNNALLRLSVGIEPLSSERWGAFLENACLAHAWNSGQQVSYWREEPLEVDGVLEGSWGRWAVEVTRGEVRSRALEGLAEFARRWPEFRPLVICRRTELSAARRLGMQALAWEDFLLAGPPET